jgi:MFS family permease
MSQLTPSAAPARGRLAALGTGLPPTFWVLCAGTFINRAGSFVVPFLAVYLTRERGLPVATAGLVAAIWGAGAAVASPLGGWLADHVGRRVTLVSALALGGIGMIALGFARELPQLTVGTFLVALVGECYRPAMQAAVSDLVAPVHRVRAFGLLYWVINLGFSVGLLLGGALATRSFLWLFLGDGLASLAYAGIGWWFVPETRPHAPATAGEPPVRGFVRGFLAPYRDRPFLAFVVLSVLILLIFMQHIAAFPVEMAARGLPTAWLGFVLALNGIVIVLVQPFLAPWLTRFDHSRTLAAGAVLVGLGFGINAFAAGPLGFSLGVVVWTLGEILVLPIGNALVADVALPGMRGRYQGAYGLSFGVAGFLAPLLGTLVLQRWGSAALWLGCLALGLAVAAGQLALAPRLRRLRDARVAEAMAAS